MSTPRPAPLPVYAALCPNTIDFCSAGSSDKGAPHEPLILLPIPINSRTCSPVPGAVASRYLYMYTCRSTCPQSEPQAVRNGPAYIDLQVHAVSKNSTRVRSIGFWFNSNAKRMAASVVLPPKRSSYAGESKRGQSTPELSKTAPDVSLMPVPVEHAVDVAINAICVDAVRARTAASHFAFTQAGELDTRSSTSASSRRLYL